MTGPMRKHHEHERMLLGTTNSKWRSGQACLLCCLLFFAPLKNVAQNLVPNPSFELLDSCPQYPILTGYQPGAVPQYWYRSSDSPDYFNACVDTATSVPDNIVGYQVAYDGVAYSGFASVQAEDHREMIGVPLTDAMVVGETYYVSFYAVAGAGGTQPTGLRCNNIGVLFCMNAYYWMPGIPEFDLRNFAHMYSDQVIGDTAEWTLVSGSLVADSAYSYMVVGNHFDNSNTTIDTIVPGNQFGYHLVDQFCVSREPTGCPLASVVHEGSLQEVGVFPNPAQNDLRVRWNLQRLGHLRLVDMLGRTIWEEQVAGRKDIVVDVSSWARGHYVLTTEVVDIRLSYKIVLVE